MDRAEGLAIIQNEVADCLGIEPAEVAEDSRLIEDLGADSLDIIDLIFALEEKFEVKLRDDELDFLSRIDMSDPEVIRDGFLTPQVLEKVGRWVPLDAVEDPTRVSPSDLLSLFSVSHLWRVVESKMNG